MNENKLIVNCPICHKKGTLDLLRDHLIYDCDNLQTIEYANRVVTEIELLNDLQH